MIFIKNQFLVGATLVALLALLPDCSIAQDSRTDASASALVLWSIDVMGVQNLRFDEIVMGEEKVVHLDGSVSGLHSTGSEEPGKFRIKTPQSLSLRFKDMPDGMEGPDGEYMPVEFFAAWSEEQFPDNQQLNMFDINSTLQIPSTGSVREIFLFLGARVTPAQSQLIGDYSVRVTLSIIHGI